jgi:hypothetical protein
MAALFTGCDTGTNSNSVPGPDPKVCECPPNTKHKAGEKCCDGDNCACEEEKLPVVCECPNGTIHDGTKEMPCCGGEDCTCKQKFEYPNAFRGVKVVVENQTGKDVKKYAGIVKGYFDKYGEFLTGEASNLNNRGGILTVVIEPDTGDSYTEEGYRIVNPTTYATSYEFLTSSEDANIINMIEGGVIATASHKNVKANAYNNIRLANGKTLNVGKLITFGKQFNDAKNTVRIAFASRQRQRQRPGLQA